MSDINLAQRTLNAEKNRRNCRNFEQPTVVVNFLHIRFLRFFFGRLWRMIFPLYAIVIMLVLILIQSWHILLSKMGLTMFLACTVAFFRLFSEKVSFWVKTLRSLKVNPIIPPEWYYFFNFESKNAYFDSTNCIKFINNTNSRVFVFKFIETSKL